MHPGDPESLPNPFAIELSSTRRSGRKAVVSALKLLLVVAVALSVVLVIGSLSRQWLLSRLTRDFESLSQAEKQQRLVQIAECGVPAIPVLVQKLTDADPSVARTACDLLRELQNDWTLLERAELLRRHRAMVSAVERVTAELPEDRSGWMTGLLQQTILEAVEESDEASRHLHAAASDVLAELSLQSGASGGTDPSEEAVAGGGDAPRPSALRVPVRVSARAEPLPVAAHSVDRWTHWPPSREDAPSREKPARSGDASPAPTSEETSPASRGQGDGQHAASIYRSSASHTPAVRLRPIAPGQSVTLREIDGPTGESADRPGRAGRSGGEPDWVDEATDRLSAAQPAMRLVGSPLQTLDTRSVIYWLGGTDASLREQAKQELRRRGLDERQITVASCIAGGDLAARLELVESLAHSDRLDPRPWLLMLMDDRSRDVKLRALSVLATMRDPAIRKKLRERLGHERDPTVAARLRKVLDLR